MNESSREPSDRGLALGHEPSDIEMRGLLLFVAGLFATLIVAGALVWWLLATLSQQAAQAEPPVSPFVEDRGVSPGPQLQETPTIDMNEFRAQENKRLHSAAWIDRERNLARIPIENAIKIVVKEGLPHWPAPAIELPTESTARP